MKPAETDPTLKREALRIADTEGPAEAARRTGVPSSTIRMWRTRAKQAVAPSGGIRADLSTERAREMADSARSAADAAIRRLNEILPTAKNPQSVAISLGICVDKAILLDSLIQGIEDREVRLSEAHAELLATVLKMALEAVGVPLTPAVRAVVRDLLRQASAGGVLAVSPALAQPAFSDVREAIRRQFADELADVRGLPAPEVHDGQDPDVVDAEPEPEPDVVDQEPELVTDAEVVEDPVPRHFLEAYTWNRPLARAKWEEHKAREARQRETEAEQTPSLIGYRPSTFRGQHDIFNSNMRNPPGAG